MQENNEVFKFNLREIEYHIKFLDIQQRKSAINKVFEKFNEMDESLNKKIKNVNKKIRIWKTFTALNISVSAICMFITYFNFSYIGIAFAMLLMGFGTWYTEKNIEKNKQVYIQAKQEIYAKLKEFEVIAEQLINEIENSSENKHSTLSQKLTIAPIKTNIKKSLTEKEM